jgi:hypothetical protein
MPFSGGTYTKWNSASGGWVGDKTAGTGILATRHDSQDDDFATAINSCLTKTGANSPTANINWAGYKITSLGNATTSGDAVNLGQLQVASGFYLDTVNNRVGINNTSPSEKLDIAGNIRVGGQIYCNTGRFRANRANATSATSEGGIEFLIDGVNQADIVSPAASTLAVYTAGSERFRVHSNGQIGINSATTYNSLLNLLTGPTANVNQTAIGIRANANGNYAMGFLNASGTQVGYIEIQAAGTFYSQTSDYRLKQNIQPFTNGLNRLKALKPCTWEWIAGEGHGEGFIAHELAEVVPSAVSGEKDGMNEDGSDKYQGVDTGKLITTLVAAVQELSAKVTALEARYESEVG